MGEQDRHDAAVRLSRRQLLAQGLGALAAGAALPGAVAARAWAAVASPAPWPGGGSRTPAPGAALSALHHAPRARRVILLHMAGGPSQLDLFDPKPELQRLDGQTVEPSVTGDDRFAFVGAAPKLLASPYAFARHGESGQWISELLPELAGVVDELAVVRSMVTRPFNHVPAQLFLSTGHDRVGRPSLGAWLSWALGSENPDLPAFLVLLSGGFQPSAGAALWGPGFLPADHQGVRLRERGDPVLFLSDPPGMASASRDRGIAAITALNGLSHERQGDPAILARSAQYSQARRMQAVAPALFDLSTEPASALAAYGAVPGEASYAANCLLTRRLIESGVRCVQLSHWGWDSHGTNPDDDLLTSLPLRCRQTDRATAALLRDLRQRGLLDDTLVLWSGEFGRTPMNEERRGSKFLGRDHHPHAFTAWLAGGGVKAGLALGATDELGYHVSERPVHVHDLHATLLHLLGIDHLRLTARHQGRDFRLTDVAGEVVPELLA